ncbi:MAG TPA: hypothetical protein PKW66_22550, partial [Polyangiaceae bacterium]|nr:hypothetical protein [Polyangiaceae bacterium]
MGKNRDLCVVLDRAFGKFGCGLGWGIKSSMRVHGFFDKSLGKSLQLAAFLACGHSRSSHLEQLDYRLRRFRTAIKPKRASAKRAV